MPTKTSFTTEELLRSTTLPDHGGKYAVVSHGRIIDETRKELTNAGFEIDKELYRASQDGQIAQGIYHLNYGTDKDMGLMFAWSNSYNKMMKFKCAVGGQVFICMNGVVSGDLASYSRKHMGANTLTNVVDHIKDHISHATEYYSNLIADKEMLKNIELPKALQGQIIGELFIDKEILTLTQVGIIKREIDKPSFDYNAPVQSAWSLYNHITLALKESHPMHYLSDHQKVHSYFIDQFGRLQSPLYDSVEPDIVEDDDLPAFTLSEHDKKQFGVTFQNY